MANTGFPQFPRPGHDPNTRDEWGQEFFLQLGRSIRVVTVTLVDGSDGQIIGSDLVLDAVTFGLLDASTNKWCVKFFANGGASFLNTTVAIRYRFWLDDNLGDTTTPASFDRTVRLVIEQT